MRRVYEWQHPWQGALRGDALLPSGTVMFCYFSIAPVRCSQAWQRAAQTAMLAYRPPAHPPTPFYCRSQTPSPATRCCTLCG